MGRWGHSGWRPGVGCAGNEAWGLRLPIWVESDALTMGTMLDSELQGCHAVISGWAHGPKQKTKYTVSRGVPIGKWHLAVT